MKKVIKIFLLLILLSTQYFSQVNWNLDDDSANFAFLKVDYNTYEFEGGYFTKFPYQEGYDSENIPFTVIYNSPGDYGNIAFLYAATSDTIFAADIWWMGTGQITFPNSIEDASRFSFDSTNVTSPFNISYINYVAEIPDSVFRPKADSAWQSIRKISVLKQFSAKESVFRVGLYLYAPTVGVFNPYVAKWIIFLYRGQIITGVEDDKGIPNSFELFQNYPNPFNPNTTINYSISEKGFVQLKVYDLLGKEVTTLVNEEKTRGNYSVSFSGSNLPSGVYIYSIRVNNFIQNRKMILLR